MGIEGEIKKEKKESATSFEDFKRDVAEAVKLFRQLNVLGIPSIYWRGPVRYEDWADFSGKIRRRHEADTDVLKEIPGFEDLVKEETDILTSGASKEEISDIGNLYQKVFERRNEVVEQLRKKLDDTWSNNGRKGMEVYRTAEVVAAEEKSSSAALINGFIKQKFEELQKDEKADELQREREAKRQELQERYGVEYVTLTRRIEAGLKGLKLKAELTIMEDQAKIRGFASAEDMWTNDAEALLRLEEKVGKEDFKLLKDK